MNRNWLIWHACGLSATLAVTALLIFLLDHR
jgi:hypothetical protein